MPSVESTTPRAETKLKECANVSPQSQCSLEPDNSITSKTLESIVKCSPLDHKTSIVHVFLVSEDKDIELIYSSNNNNIYAFLIIIHSFSEWYSQFSLKIVKINHREIY